MWVDAKDQEGRDALVQGYLERRKRLQARLVAEKLGEADLFSDASKVFKPITAAAAERAAEQTAELKKVTKAIEALPAQIAAEPNPFAVMFDESGSRPALLPATTERQSQPADAAVLLDPDKDLTVSVIRKHGFKPPSELDLSNGEQIQKLSAEVTHFNRYTLGSAKKRAKGVGDRDQAGMLTKEIEALAAYRQRLLLLARGMELSPTKKTGTGLPLKLLGNRFGNLTVDPVSLMAGQLRAFDSSGNQVFEAPADESLYDLLTKRFVKSKQYTPAAVEAFKSLVALAGLPVHGRRSKKHRLVQGGGSRNVEYYSDPNQLVQRLQLLTASKMAGNTGVDNEISAIIDELSRSETISREMVVQLNRALL